MLPKINEELKNNILQIAQHVNAIPLSQVQLQMQASEIYVRWLEERCLKKDGTFDEVKVRNYVKALDIMIEGGLPIMNLARHPRYKIATKIKASFFLKRDRKTGYLTASPSPPSFCLGNLEDRPHVEFEWDMTPLEETKMMAQFKTRTHDEYEHVEVIKDYVKEHKEVMNGKEKKKSE